MDKRLIQPLEGFMAIPQIVGVLGLSRARIHQLIDEDRFNVEDLRVVGDKRMVVIKNAAVYRQLQAQEERAQRLALDHEAEEQRLLGRCTTNSLGSTIVLEAVHKKAYNIPSFVPMRPEDEELAV